MRDLAVELAENAATISYERLSRAVVDTAKLFILDTLAVLVAGSNAPGCRNLVDQVKEWGGQQESSILVYGSKVISPNACRFR